MTSIYSIALSGLQAASSRLSVHAENIANQQSEGYRPVRQFRYVIVGVATRTEADALAAKLHGSVEPGGELVWETAPDNPFAVFGGLGG